MSLPNIEVSFRHFPDEAADGIHVSHITDDVLFCVCNIGGSNAYDVHVLLRDGLEPGGIMGVDLAPCEEVSYPLKRILGNKLKQVRRKIGFTSGSESLELIFDVSYRSDKGQHVTTSRFALDGSTRIDSGECSILNGL